MIVYEIYFKYYVLSFNEFNVLQTTAQKKVDINYLVSTFIFTLVSAR